MLQRYFLHRTLTVLFVTISFTTFAQQSEQNAKRLATDQEALHNMAERFKERQKKDDAQIEALKNSGDAMIMEVGENGKIIQLVRFNDRGMPEYYETHNSNAAITTSTSDVHPSGGAGFSLTGDSVEIGEWDGGAVRATHQELTGRITQVDGATTQSNHATHVAGTMIASGVQSSAKGMAYQSSIQAHDFSNDESEMATYAATNNAVVSNHSYGTITGWYYSSSQSAWYWYGDTAISSTEDYYFGFYNYWASIWDTIANSAPYYLIVKSAGNDRNDNISASANDTHYVWNSGWQQSTTTRAADCPTGYDCISTNGNAKNILTVGAVSDISSGYTSPSQVVMSSFSGWGPTDDGRIKPDLVGNGVSLYSSGAGSNTDYYNSSGTSMSAPNVTGSLALIQEYYKDETGGYMLSSALKGLSIHTANEAGSNDGPDYKFGWGLLDTRAAVEHLDDTNALLMWDDLANGDSLVFNYYFDGSEPIVATICWNDPAGTPTSAQLDPSTSMLVNDLDLRVRNDSSGTVYQPWILNPSSPASAATTGDNFRDNVEKIEIDNPDPGFYTFTINHKGTMSASQQVSIMISRKADPPVACVPSSSTINETICDGQTYTSPLGNNLTSSGTYFDTLNNAGGCDSVITINLTVSDPLVSTTVSGGGCSGGTPSINATASNGISPYSFLWSNGSTSAAISGIANGTYSVTITDSEGCTDSTSAVLNAGIDNIAPVVITQSISIDLNASGLASITSAQIDNGSSDNCGIASMTVSPNNFDCSDVGSNQVTLTVTDTAGNSAQNTATVTVNDALAPSVQTQNLTVYLDGSGQASITALQVDNGSSDACGIQSLSLSTTSFSCNETGSNTVTLTATDVSGNSANQTATITVLDTMNPTLTAANDTLSLDGSGQATLNVTSVASASDNCSISQMAASTTSFNCNDIGMNTVTITATDPSGNVENETIQIWVVDDLPPQVSGQNLTVNLNSNGQATLSPAAMASGVSDNCGVDSMGVSQSTFDCNDLGGVQVTITVMDASGNMTQATTTVNVIDNQSPTVTTHSTTIYLDSNGMAGVSPAQVTDTIDDNCGIDQLFVTPASFDCASVGTVTVTVFASDAAGNTTNTNAQVTIVDEMPPTIMAQAQTLYLDANGQASITAMEVDNGSYDNCGVESYALTKSDFTCNDEGMASTELVVTDIHGNSDSMTVAVNVIDTFNTLSGWVWRNGIEFGGTDSVSVSLVQGATYQWSANNGTIVSQNLNEAVVTYSAGQNAKVQVIQTAPTGCLDTASRKVRVWPLSVNKIGEGQQLFNVYPNPTSSLLNLEMVTGEIHDASIILINQLGQAVIQKDGISLKSSENWQINLEGLAVGVYTLSVRHAGKLETFKVLLH